MDWIKDNKFLAGFAGFTIVAALGLIYFLVTGWMSYTESYEEYQDLAAQNDTLAKRKVYPQKENLEAEKTRVAGYTAKVDDLQTRLVSSQKAVEDIDVDRFPVLLKNAYDEIVAKSAAANFSIPEDFYFGMGVYKEGVPQKGAVDELGFQLSAIQHLTNLLIESGATAIDDLVQRVPMDSESGPAPGPGGGAKKPKRPPVIGRDGEVPYMPGEVMDRYRLTIQFTAQPDAMVEFLNKLANDREYFYWVRYFRIENESKEGKDREEDFQPKPVPVDPGEAPGDGVAPGVVVDPAFDNEGLADPAGAPADAPAVAFDDAGNLVIPDQAGGGNGAMIDARILFGDEDVKARMVIDIVRFAEPEVEEDEGGTPNPAGANAE